MRPILLSLAVAALLPLTAAVPLIVQAQQTVKQPPLITEFQQIEDKWSTSLVRQDQYTLETILSPTFVDISPVGEVSTRNQVVADMFEKSEPQQVTMEQRVVNVRMIEDVAIVDGTYVERTKLNGVEREERGVFTHIYQHAREAWVCVQSQRTALPAEETEKKSTEKKKSDAAEPFHIPLFYKGAESTKQTSPQPAPQP